MDDPLIFLVTAFKEEVIRGFKEPFLDSIKLREANAHVFISVQEIDNSKNRAHIICNVDSVEVSEVRPRPFSRGRGQAIEAVIHATRIDFLFREGRIKEGEELVERFGICKEVVRSVSTPDSAEGKVIMELDRLIEGWRGNL